MRKRIIRRMRKNIMRIGTILEDKPLNRDDDGTLLPKKERGYVIRCKVNGWDIVAPDRNRYESYKGAYDCAKWAMEDAPNAKE